MRRTFYRALDRPVSIIGLKGRWVGRFFVLAGASLLCGIVVGSCSDSGTGIATVFVGAFGSFFYCLVRQQKVSSRRLAKEPLKGRMNVCVRRRSTLSRILLVSNNERKDI